MSSLRVAGLMALLLAPPVVEPGAGQPTSGVVSRWPGEGDAADTIDGNSGTLYGGTTFAPGVVGSAFSFDGIDDGINVQDADNLKFTSSFSIAAWVKVESFPSVPQFWGQILFRGDDRGGLDPYFLAVNPFGEIVSHIESLSGEIVTLEAAIPLGEFVHVRASLADPSGRMALYLNGALVAETTTAVRPFRDLDPASNPAVGIGNHPQLPGTPHHQPFHGLIVRARRAPSAVRGES